MARAGSRRGERPKAMLVTRKRVRRLMRLMGLMSRCRPEKVSTKPARRKTVRGDFVCTSHVFVGLPFCKLGPAIRGQVLGVFCGHIDSAVFPDVQMPTRVTARKPADGKPPATGPMAVSNRCHCLIHRCRNSETLY
jgi:hypothetical protein